MRTRGDLVEQHHLGPAARVEIFEAPREERTRQFLQRVIDARRL